MLKLKPKQQDREYIQKLLQDMKVRVRDIENYAKGRRYKRTIEKIEKGYEEEYNKLND